MEPKALAATENQAEQIRQLPNQENGSFKLLGLTLDNQWASHGHQESLLKKLRKRMAVLRKASNATWGLGNRVLTMTAHDLVESVIGYGLTLTGSSTTAEDIEQYSIR